MKMHIKICKNRNVLVTHINLPWSLMSIFIIVKHYFILFQFQFPNINYILLIVVDG